MPNTLGQEFRTPLVDGQGVVTPPWQKRFAQALNAENISLDPAGLAHTSATDVQEALDDLDAAIGAAGGGDVTGPGASVDSELAIYNGASGQIIKRSTHTGILKGASGVLSAATPGTDYLTKATALPAFVTLTDGATVTWDFNSEMERSAVVTLGGNRTLAISSMPAGAEGVLIVKQDATGGRTLTLPAGSKVNGGGAGAITLSTAASAIDILSVMYDGTNYFWALGANYT